MDATSVGDVFVDLITAPLDDFPERDRQKIIGGLYPSTGGCAANFSLALSRLGLKTRLIARVGDDAFTKFVKESLSGVDLKLKVGGKTGLTYAVAFRDGKRSFITYLGANASFCVRDVDFDLIEGRYLHVASFFLQGLKEDTVKLMDCAHDKGMFASFDTGWDPCGWSKRNVKSARKVIKSADIFLPNFDEARMITGLSDKNEICDSLMELGPKLIALKGGSAGSFIATPKERVSLHAYSVKVVDSTGAGDAFNAGLVYAHSRGWSIKKTGLFANACGALSVTGFGTENYATARKALALMASF